MPVNWRKGCAGQTAYYSPCQETESAAGSAFSEEEDDRELLETIVRTFNSSGMRKTGVAAKQ